MPKMLENTPRAEPAATQASPSFEVCLDRYARLLVEIGARLRRDQPLFILADSAHRDLALRVAEAGYDAGAGVVSTFLADPRQHEQLIRRGRPEQIEMAHAREQQWLNEVVTSHGALISLRGEEDPALMPEVARRYPERHTLFMRSAGLKGRVLLNHGVNRGLCPWVVAGAATPGWAGQVFPGLPEAEAVEKLWRQIFAFTECDREDVLERNALKDRRLHGRRKLLDALAIRELHIEGGGSDLRVGLSAAARWLGGSKHTASGQAFQANVPTEENFTTPDRFRTEGRLVATMPFRTKVGLLVEGLVMEFEQGRLTRFEAKSGGEGFNRWIDLDDGARFLGEVALVGGDSPIARSGLFFEHTLFDENAWPHVALGQAYTAGIENGSEMPARELAELGFNSSTIHTDIMVGSPQVSIHAAVSNEGVVTLIDRGQWTERFRDPE
jgi:aminopeptidase